MNELREKKYKYEKVKSTGEMAFTEDGHTMFFEDVLKRLNRLEYLESIQSQPINKELEKEKHDNRGKNKFISMLQNIVEQKQKKIDELEKENERLRKRDCNATIQLCYETEDFPFNREDLKIVDVGVSDNEYIVESKKLNHSLNQITQLQKKIDKYENFLIELSLNHALVHQIPSFKITNK